MKKVISILFFLLASGFLQAQTDSLLIKKLFNEAYDFEVKNPDSALAIYNKIIKLSNNDKFLVFEAKANNYKGIVFNDIGKYDSAFVFYNKSISNFEKIGDKKGVGANLINIGNTNKIKGDLPNAIFYYQKGIKIYEELQDDAKLSISYGNLATIFEDIGQITEAQKHYLRSVVFAKKANDSIQLVTSFYNLSNLHAGKSKSDSALFYINKAKKFLSITSDYHLKSIVSYGEARCLLNENKFESALNKSKQALVYELENNNPYYIALNQNLIGNVYFKQRKLDQALKYTLKAAETSLEYGNKSSLTKIYQQLSDIYKAKKNNEKALFYKELEVEVKDEVLSEKVKYRFKLLNIKYETEKKDKEIITQQLELKKQESEIQKKKTQNTYMLAIVVVLLVASVLLMFLFKQRQKRKNQEIITLKREYQIKTLESLIEGEEKERFRIAKELHDGVNGDLSAIKYKLSSLLEMNNKVIKEAITMIDSSCKQVRAISHNLVPPSLEKFNLVEATEVYCGNLNDINPDVEFTFQHLGDALDISKKAEVNIFRIIQELITNSIKHADASAINVQISAHNNTIQVSIEDDGKGFDKDAVKSDGIGLSNVQSRIDYLKASVDFISNEKGTSYTIDIDKEKLNDN